MRDGGGGLGQWDTASWKPAFGEAPCLMGAREVNSTTLKLYLIFIHMNAPGPRSITANKLKRRRPQRPVERKAGRTWRMGGGGGKSMVSINF